MQLKQQCLFVLLSLGIVTCGQAAEMDAVGWLDKDDNWPEKKQRLQTFGEQFDTAIELYDFLESSANGGEQLDWQDMGEPAYDWSGIYTRTGGGLSFDPDIRASETTAQLTATGAAARQVKIDRINETGGEYDPISDCRPPGFPRWATEPFLHEFIVTPDQTWLINEMVNDIRRVYTDGSEHADHSHHLPVERPIPARHTAGLFRPGGNR